MKKWEAKYPVTCACCGEKYKKGTLITNIPDWLFNAKYVEIRYGWKREYILVSHLEQTEEHCEMNWKLGSRDPLTMAWANERGLSEEDRPLQQEEGEIKLWDN